MPTHAPRPALAAKVPEVFAELLGVSLGDITVRTDDPSGADFVITTGPTFVLDFKVSTSAAPVAAAAKQVRAMAERLGNLSLPVLAVPFMGDVGRQVCADAGISWLDLSGNAHITAPGIRIIIDGHRNRFRAVGRPENLFAPKSSRIVRRLLMDPAQPLTQREIARATGLDEGFVSRLVGRLEHDDYLMRDDQGALKPKDPGLLLDAWRDAYRFDKHAIRKGHVVARSGDALLQFAADVLAEQGIDYAATGLAGAWALTRFAAFRLTTIFVPADPSPAILERLGFREEERGANLWLVVPNDQGVFHGAMVKDGLRCAHPAQIYVDLKDQRARAPESAERLRTDFLTWGERG